MQKLRGDIDADDVQDTWARAEDAAKKVETHADPMKRLFGCMQCLLQGRKGFMKPLAMFGICRAQDILPKIMAVGAWIRCSQCQGIAAQCWRTHGRQPMQAGCPNLYVQNSENVAILPCTTRANDRPLDSDDKAALKNKSRNKTHICNVCKGMQHCDRRFSWHPTHHYRPNQIHCRSCHDIKCATCGENKLPHLYSPFNRNPYFSHMQNVSCNDCLDKTKRHGRASIATKGKT